MTTEAPLAQRPQQGHSPQRPPLPIPSFLPYFKSLGVLVPGTEGRRVAGSQGPAQVTLPTPQKIQWGQTEARPEVRWGTSPPPPPWTKAACVLTRGRAPHKGALCAVP